MAPVWLLAALGFGVFALLAGSLIRYQRAAVTTVVVLRHAEKELGSIADAPLSPAGGRRAELLASMLGDGDAIGRPVAIYVTDTRRSQQTAGPLARRLNLMPTVVDGEPQAIVAQIDREHHGEVVVVIGHSNTVPTIVAQLAGIHGLPEIKEDEYGTMYVVSVPSLGKASVLKLTY